MQHSAMTDDKSAGKICCRAYSQVLQGSQPGCGSSSRWRVWAAGVCARPCHTGEPQLTRASTLEFANRETRHVLLCNGSPGERRVRGNGPRRRAHLRCTVWSWARWLAEEEPSSSSADGAHKDTEDSSAPNSCASLCCRVFPSPAGCLLLPWLTSAAAVEAAFAIPERPLLAEVLWLGLADASAPMTAGVGSKLTETLRGVLCLEWSDIGIEPVPSVHPCLGSSAGASAPSYRSGTSSGTSSVSCWKLTDLHYPISRCSKLQRGRLFWACTPLCTELGGISLC